MAPRKDPRFLLDEHIDHVVATALRLRGRDVRTLAEAGLLGADDLHDILPRALADQRILITRDADFLSLAASGVPHAGIVYWPGKRRDQKEAIRYLLLLARRETSESMMGQVRFVKERYP